MKQSKLLKIFYGGALGLFTVLGVASLAQASGSISASPSSGTHTVGTAFTVTVAADGGGSNLTVATATVSVSNLTIDSLSLASGIICQTQPSASAPSFTACGKTGEAVSSRTIYTMSVKGTAAGAASISVSGGKIVNADGSGYLGTSLSSTASYTIEAAAAAAEEETPAVTPAPTCAITANPTSVAAVNDKSTLTWSTTNATSVSASWTSSTATSGSQSVTVRYAPSSIFRMTVTGAGGTATCSVSVKAPEAATTTTAATTTETETPAVVEDTAPTTPDSESGLATQWGTYTVDTSLALNISSTAVLTPNLTADTITGTTFTGTATPGALVTVYVFSTKITKSTTVGDDGKWTITLTEPLASGVHTVYAIATKAGVTTRTAAKQLILVDTSKSTVVKTTAAAEAAKVAAAKAETTKTTEQVDTTKDYSLWYWIGGGVFALLAVLAVIFYLRIRKRAIR